MDKRIIIFGGGGFVGGNMSNAAAQLGWEVIIADSFDMTGSAAGFRKVNITDPAAVDELVNEIKPAAVVNLAAIADIDKAEKEKELAWKVNVDGAGNIAAACSRAGAKYIFFSSDAVFSGEDNCYKEDSPAAPVNYYGFTKAEAEKAVLAGCRNSVIVRISLVIGFPVERGNSFFAGLEKKLKNGEDIVCPVREVRTPVDVHTLCECVLELAENNYNGVIHIGATDSINRIDLTKMAAKKLGYEESRIKPQGESTDNSRAPRHKNGIICVEHARKILDTKLLSVAESVDRAFLSNLRYKK